MKLVLVPVITILVLAALVFTAPPAVAGFNGFVDLPTEQEAAISGIFVAVFALLFDFAVGKLPWLEFFRQYREAWALSLAALFVAWFQNVLPTGFEDISIKFTAALIAVALYLLGRVVLMRRGTQGFV